MGAFACAALPHEEVGEAVGNDGGGVHGEGIAAHRRLCEEDAEHRVDGEEVMAVAGGEPEGGATETAVEAHEAEGFAGGGGEGDNVYAPFFVEARFAEVIDTGGDRCQPLDGERGFALRHAQRDFFFFFFWGRWGYWGD